MEEPTQRTPPPEKHDVSVTELEAGGMWERRMQLQDLEEEAGGVTTTAPYMETTLTCEPDAAAARQHAPFPSDFAPHVVIV